MNILHHYRTVRGELRKVWDKRDAVSLEARRAMKESPTAFRAADRKTKVAVIAILLMVSTIIVNVVLA